MAYQDETKAKVDQAMERSFAAFRQYRKLALQQRADFLQRIANELLAIEKNIIEVAHRETNLEDARLTSELKRTIFQLTSYGKACTEGTWLDIRIDTADPNNGKSDLRKMLVPLGPVVVFGASNFPFAYSTAGGDTACALAAGCSVVLKAHPAHAETSSLVAEAIQRAIAYCGLPSGVFEHIHGNSFETGQALVQHSLTRAVGFTGSFEGGKALFDLANQRQVPIPVFAEMGSVNPVFILPQKLAMDLDQIVLEYSNSITQSAGQFCTNPGILIGIENEVLTIFKSRLAKALSEKEPMPMLHPGIAKSFHEKRQKALAEKGVSLLTAGASEKDSPNNIPTLAEVDAQNFIRNTKLHQEVFGTFSLLILCKDHQEVLDVADALEGQLTATLLATPEEAENAPELLERLQDICGRFILNGVPTGVTVALPMQHGGPFPATTDSRFTAVGADGIKRFARPVCYQNWPDELLDPALKNDNPLRLWRTVNNSLTKDAIR
jgi:alpha-ketoglutaric semialdehyde dehydrogenase